MQVNLPPGAVLYDLEPIDTGWLAAGRIPSGEGSELLLIEGGGGDSILLSVPERTDGQFRGQPAVLTEQDRLAGLVWAEGDAHDQLAIWAAAWDGHEWGAPEAISPPGPGSQLAPVGVILDDGSWLAVWPAFDGTDDEIRWSRRVDGKWSTPERIHPDNDVPDLMPDVIAIDGGALVVWSWFDGNDYRLRSARLADGRWCEPKTFGDKGSGEAGLVQVDGGARLLYQTVMPASWTVLDLNRQGEALRRGILPIHTNDRPLLLVDEQGRARLHWPALESRAQPAIDYQLEWQAPE